ncbi:LLM class flavin-dependent oxidoreductase [Bordetella bronchiseptica]|uniref:LLM class flavin-dependent oxidoreductase n=1 Tax=Bordetella bronchiseptica TaxID=518 RepID=UPI00028A95A3|nr:LLM class flavin-dependent oxidoreductase [Bordetella bronchiseptica]KCV28301.1 luciferase family oxidoreductase, group 1 [Bordetella bronchiseptica 00-P-2730]KDD61579.1 luciferase family oxidoreductase, group 1 [Bordetella bronchiseptica OSU553]AUL15358.1 luciferase [Bordetella bronchiseptica]AWP58457.1 LLM class flavin-dependent oxidoreductase [Bordetella bronchiseptica]AWQ05192.1 LLM class flavin-dependent oxidoreductase [Bordetella bronchiseptica]
MSVLASVPFSVLDLAPIVQGGTAAQAFRNTVDLARHVEGWGYRRFWLAEHHNITGVASSATAVLIGHVAAHTTTLRVGSGGVMLPNHAPLIIAEQFGTLESLFPGRIDLGLGRAPGSDGATQQALRRGPRSGLDFPELLHELRAYLAPARPGQPVRAIPGAGTDVPIWLLGSSDFSARLAAELGLPFSFAGHFSPEGMAAMRLYRQLFKPSQTLARPHAMIGVPVVAADTDEQAHFLSTTQQLKFLSLIRGNRLPLQPPVESMDGVWNEWERSAVQQRLGAAIVGGPDTVKRELESLVAQTQADEVMIVSDFYDFSDRLRSYEIVASLKQDAGVSTRTANA